MTLKELGFTEEDLETALFIDELIRRCSKTMFNTLYVENKNKGAVMSEDIITDGLKHDVGKASQPTADVVAVVRCKDCKYLEITGCYGECGKALLGLVNPQDYCSRGVRRKGDTKCLK